MDALCNDFLCFFSGGVGTLSEILKKCKEGGWGAYLSGSGNFKFYLNTFLIVILQILF